eukprot:TRINITY_DN1084_c0_g1_i2.p2 TRINITY_DN1084_c0_g1~~TRINITY_DN1084_c0_g1_i2.p2  ORF type:complete len:125 (+),score=21.29 TRINITY_DN1084_c0_g1_i2:153-527(+)
MSADQQQYADYAAYAGYYSYPYNYGYGSYGEADPYSMGAAQGYYGGGYPSTATAAANPMGGYTTGAYPNRQIRQEQRQPTRSLWLGNILPEVTDQELRAEFGVFGYIESIKVVLKSNPLPWGII